MHLVTVHIVKVTIHWYNYKFSLVTFMRFCFVTYDIINRKLQHGQQCFEDTCNYIMKRKTCLHDGIVTTNLDKNGLVEIPPGRGEPDDGLQLKTPWTQPPCKECKMWSAHFRSEPWLLKQFAHHGGRQLYNNRVQILSGYQWVMQSVATFNSQ